MFNAISDRIDAIAGIEPGSAVVNKLERLSFVFLILMAVSAPHSIAATQTAWLAGTLLTAIWIVIRRRVDWKLGLLDAAIIGLFLWTVVTAFVSYDPPISLGKLRSAGIFVIFYFAVFNLRTIRSVIAIATILIVSCIVNVVWVPIERLIGRGVEIHQIEPNGPLARAHLSNGDTVLTANKVQVRTPEDLLAIVEKDGTADVRYYRPDFEMTGKVITADLLPGDSAQQRLGIGTWKKSRNWRSAGFYGHYATYAEVLQLIGSLLLGLLVAGFLIWRKDTGDDGTKAVSLKLLLAMAGSFGLIAFALLLTVTRAPQLGLFVSGAVITLFGLGRKWLLAAALIMVPVAIGGLIFLQQSRHVGFLDSADESTRYRTVMVKDGIRIWTESPRNFIFGVGMDSIRTHWQEWGMFEGGKLPISHLHSTPLQLVVERGLPALIIWLLIMFAYSRKLLEGIGKIPDLNWQERGILLGALGGLAGFLVSGIVHFNFGDQEVVMAFYLIMALSMVICRRKHAAE